MSAKTLDELIGKIHQGDCVQGMKQVASESIHLIFADPPFNIGYEYDEYEDQLEDERYLAWSRDWMSEVHRVLLPHGAFWLAIGDEYAAELKLAAQEIGFHCRSWVIWYYTFGVHCKNKFTRSHAHLFHFVKDSQQFTFHRDAIAVPSARQLVYADRRANPSGRTPDDTWILRPQDCVDGFTADEDTWYFPRVAGTFKERAGFHGCQMPEQLLGRIIRSCSSDGEIILDPFAGSATTVAVAKKLGRRFVAFELSVDYAELGTRRLQAIKPGDPLDGAAEPTVSAPATGEGRNARNTAPNKSKRQSTTTTDAQGSFEFLHSSHLATDLETQAQLETDAIVGAFVDVSDGYSVDRVVIDPELNQAFQRRCDDQSVLGSPSERNRSLFRLRHSGHLKRLGIQTTRRTTVDDDFFSVHQFAAECAWKLLSQMYLGLSLDDILCEPRYARAFDELATAFSPGFEPFQFRWAAIKLRKQLATAKARAEKVDDAVIGIEKFDETAFLPLAEWDLESLRNVAGVYLIRSNRGQHLFAGESADMGERLQAQLSSDAIAGWPGLDLAQGSSPMESSCLLAVACVDTVDDFPLVRRNRVSLWYEPIWNLIP